MLFEPSRSPYDLNFRLFDIPVRVHWSFWLVALLFGMNVQEPGALMIWVAVVFVSVLAHELGHALVARYYRRQPWITLYSLGGLASYRAGGLSARQEIAVLLAGPGAGFLLAGIVIAIVAATQHSIGLLGYQIGSGPSIDNERLWELVSFLLFVNIGWGVINLFPVYPLDGGQIARHIFISLDSWRGLRQSLWLSVLAGGLLAIFGLISGQIYMTILFGMMAFNSYQQLQGGSGSSPW